MTSGLRGDRGQALGVYPIMIASATQAGATSPGPVTELCLNRGRRVAVITEDVDQPIYHHKSRKTALAALRPGRPETPPPGWEPAPHR